MRKFWVIGIGLVVCLFQKLLVIAGKLLDPRFCEDNGFPGSDVALVSECSRKGLETSRVRFMFRLSPTDVNTLTIVDVLGRWHSTASWYQRTSYDWGRLGAIYRIVYDE